MNKGNKEKADEKTRKDMIASALVDGWEGVFSVWFLEACVMR